MESDYLFAIDPGEKESAILSWNGEAIGSAMILPNDKLLKLLTDSTKLIENRAVCIEMIASYGMPVGKETFDTVLWIGRFYQVTLLSGGSPKLIYRRDVKMHLCGQARAKDANIAQALRDRFGSKGTKSAPGVTRPLRSHLWQAFAVAVYAWDARG